ncbi:MAG TPA: XrtA system polysaccharide chain length determinant [Steroidobacteraceae bacterium]
MQEILEQARAIARSLWRYRWIALVVTWGVALVAWGVILCLPNKYEASARVFVDPSTALRPVIQGLAIEQDVNAELNLVRHSLMSRAHLQKIILETGLAPTAKTEQAMEKAINALGDRIDIASASAVAGQETAASKLYTISYVDMNRDRSIQVVKILLDSFMEGTLGGKRNGSLEAQAFVESQIKDYEQRLSQAEQRLAEFKKQNVGLVPGENDQQNDYFSRLQTELDAVKKTQTQLSIAQQRRAALEQQLHGEGALAAGPTQRAVVGPNGVVQAGGDTLSRIQETQAKLDELLLRFTEKHPDVIALRQTLQDLKQRRQTELEALKRGEAGAAAATGASSNPVYQSIQLALNNADVEIAGLRGELGDHESKVADLRRMVDTMPQVEAEFARLNRDYTVNKAEYTALLQRLQQAKLGEQADQKGSVRFEVIDPPTADFRPVSPKRTPLLLGALLAAVAAGGGAAYLLSMLRPVFHTARQLGELTGIVVYGAVSAARDATKTLSMRRQYIVYSFACSVLLFALVAVVFVGRTYSPLGIWPHN